MRTKFDIYIFIKYFLSLKILNKIYDQEYKV